MLFHKVFYCILLCFMLITTGIEGQSHLKIDATDVSCYGNKDGTIHIEFNGRQPSDFQILVSDSAKQLIREFDSSTTVPLQIMELSSGKYFISLISPAMNETRSISIDSPQKLHLELIRILKLEGRGESVKASLQAFPSGGTVPYLYQWSENTGNQHAAIATDLPMGIYNCKVNDKNNCGPVEATFYLFEDEITTYEKSNTTK
jgi:hypothetical protein